MTTEKIKDIVQKHVNDTSGKWMQVDDVVNLLESMLEECIRLVEETPRTCAFTTHDLGCVECTIEKAAEQIRQSFDLKKHYRYKT